MTGVQGEKAREEGERELLSSPLLTPIIFFSFSLFYVPFPLSERHHKNLIGEDPIIKSNSRNVIQTFKTDLSPFSVDFKK